MIISKTPFRISLFGGGTDYPAWYLNHGGMVIGTTIDKHCYLAVNRLPPFFDHKYRIIWSKIECVKAIKEIEHPAVKATLREMGFGDEGLGLEIAYRADLPARSGLGTSSAFTVGLLNALYALRGRRISKNVLAQEAIRIEQQVLGEAVGSQDQIWAAFGDFNTIEFYTNGSFSVEPLSIKNREAVFGSMLLFFTGFSRTADVIAQRQIDNIDNSKTFLREMMAICRDAQFVLRYSEDPLPQFAQLLNESWLRKKKLAVGITTPAIEDIYAAALKAGAVAGKLLGAGGGGFMLFLAAPERHQRIIDALGLVHVPFRCDEVGSQIIVDTGNGQ